MTLEAARGEALASVEELKEHGIRRQFTLVTA